jgi:hypothetical protein
MRGLDPRIRAIVGAASSRCARVDGRNKSGHDNLEWRKRHSVFGSARIGNFPDSLAWGRDGGRQQSLLC